MRMMSEGSGGVAGTLYRQKRLGSIKGRRLWRTLTWLDSALAKRNREAVLEGSGKLSGVTTVDGIVQVTFLGVTDDANVFDTLSGALLDVRIQLEVQPDIDVQIRRK